MGVGVDVGAPHREHLDAELGEKLAEVGQVAAVGGDGGRALAEQERRGELLGASHPRRQAGARSAERARGGHGEGFDRGP